MLTDLHKTIELCSILMKRETDMSNNFRSEAVLEYELKNVRTLDVGAYSSKIFFVRNLPWQIIVRIKPMDDKKYIGIYLKCSYSNTNEWSCSVERKTKLINFQNNLATMTIYHEKREYTNRETCRGVNKFARFDHIADPRHGFIRDDAIKIIIEIKVGLPRNCSWTVNDLYNILAELSSENIASYNEYQAKDKLKFIREIHKNVDNEFRGRLNGSANSNQKSNPELLEPPRLNSGEQRAIDESKKRVRELTDENSRLRLNILTLEMEKNDLKLAMENVKVEAENARMEEKKKRSVRFTTNGYTETSSTYIFLRLKDKNNFVVVTRQFLEDNWSSIMENCIKDKNTDNVEIFLDMELDLLMKILQFFHTGKFDDSQFESIYSVIEISKMHNVRSLEEYCKDKIMEGISVTNAIETLLIVKSKNLGDLRSRIVKYIRKNLEQFTKTNEWKELSEKHPELSRYILQKKAVE